jgi:hypothetical protein
LAYALHILKHRHEYGSTEETMEMLNTCNKGAKNELLTTFYTYLATTGFIDQGTEGQ